MTLVKKHISESASLRNMSDYKKAKVALTSKLRRIQQRLNAIFINMISLVYNHLKVRIVVFTLT